MSITPHIFSISNKNLTISTLKPFLRFTRSPLGLLTFVFFRMICDVDVKVGPEQSEEGLSGVWSRGLGLFFGSLSTSGGRGLLT